MSIGNSNVDSIFIENRRSLALLTESLNLAAKPQTWLKTELCDQLQKVRSIRRADWSHVQSWDCGRQDALGDSHTEVFRRWEALKCAWRIQRGDARHMMRLVNRSIGND